MKNINFIWFFFGFILIFALKIFPAFEQKKQLNKFFEFVFDSLEKLEDHIDLLFEKRDEKRISRGEICTLEEVKNKYEEIKGDELRKLYLSYLFENYADDNFEIKIQSLKEFIKSEPNENSHKKKFIKLSFLNLFMKHYFLKNNNKSCTKGFYSPEYREENLKEQFTRFVEQNVDKLKGMLKRDTLKDLLYKTFDHQIKSSKKLGWLVELMSKVEESIMERKAENRAELIVDKKAIIKKLEECSEDKKNFPFEKYKNELYEIIILYLILEKNIEITEEAKTVESICEFEREMVRARLKKEGESRLQEAVREVEKEQEIAKESAVQEKYEIVPVIVENVQESIDKNHPGEIESPKSSLSSPRIIHKESSFVSENLPFVLWGLGIWGGIGYGLELRKEDFSFLGDLNRGLFDYLAFTRRPFSLKRLRSLFTSGKLLFGAAVGGAILAYNGKDKEENPL